MVVPRRPLRDAGGVRERRRARSRARSSPLGQSGVGFAYRDGRPVVWLDFPYREEPLRYDGSETPAPPDVRTLPLAAGRARRARRSRRATRRRCVASGDAVRGSAAGSASRRPRRSPRTASTAGTTVPDPPRLSRRARFDRDGVGERDAHARLVGERRAVRVRAAPPRPARRQRGVRRRGRGRARPRRRQPRRPAARSGRSGRTSAAGRGAGIPTTRALHARTLADATLFMLRAGGRWAGRRALEPRRRPARAARRRRAAGRAPRRDRRRRVVGGHGRHGVDPARSSRRATSTRRARAGEYYRRFDTWYGAPEDVDLAPTLRGRLRGA